MPTHTRQGLVLPDGVKTGRASLATPETVELWRAAYHYFQTAPAIPAPSFFTTNERRRYERTQRMNHVMERLGLTRKQAKRRVKNFEQAKRLGRV